MQYHILIIFIAAVFMIFPIGCIDMQLDASGPGRRIDLYFGIAKIGPLVVIERAGMNDLQRFAFFSVQIAVIKILKLPDVLK